MAAHIVTIHMITIYIVYSIHRNYSFYSRCITCIRNVPDVLHLLLTFYFASAAVQFLENRTAESSARVFEILSSQTILFLCNAAGGCWGRARWCLPSSAFPP